jgi:hypothetical protein
MSIKERKNGILTFILQQMQKGEFQRGSGNRDGKVMGFCDYQEFVEHQSKTISSINEQTLTTMEWLRDEVIPISLLMDKEYMSDRQASGFCFDSKNRIVLFNER